jgi:hypothetical protein
LNDFTAGWVYVFGVGVIAGMVRSVPTDASEPSLTGGS